MVKNGHLFSMLTLQILFLSIVYDCISPCFSVRCKLWIELVLSIHLSLGLPRGLFPPTFIVVTCFPTFVSSHHMAIPRKAFLGGMCDDWLDHCIAAELFNSDSVFPCFALNFISVVCTLGCSALCSAQHSLS